VDADGAFEHTADQQLAVRRVGYRGHLRRAQVAGFGGLHIHHVRGVRAHDFERIFRGEHSFVGGDRHGNVIAGACEAREVVFVDWLFKQRQVDCVHLEYGLRRGVADGDNPLDVRRDVGSGLDLEVVKPGFHRSRCPFGCRLRRHDGDREVRPNRPRRAPEQARKRQFVLPAVGVENRCLDGEGRGDSPRERRRGRECCGGDHRNRRPATHR